MIGRARWFVMGVLAVLFVAVFVATRMLMSVDTLHAWAAAGVQVVERHRAIALAVYTGVYGLLVTLGLPVVIPLSVLGGYLFGVVLATGGALAGALAGSAIFFAVASRGCATFVHARHGSRFERFQHQMKMHGMWYLPMIHFSCVVPFFVINSCAACAQMSFSSFLVGTMMGFTPIAFIYAYAGRELGQIASFADIFSPQLLSAFALLITLAVIALLVQCRHERVHRSRDF